MAWQEQNVPMVSFADKLRGRARSLGLSDAEVARRAGLNERRYAHYVSGTREPNLKALVKICSVLAIAPNELLDLEGPEKRKDGGDSDRTHLTDKIRSALASLSLDDLSLAADFMSLLASRNYRTRRPEKATRRRRSV